MSRLGALYFRVLHAVRGSKVDRFLRQISQAPFQPPSQIRREQFRSLKRLLAHAERRVPYYREVFERLGITSDDIRSFEDLERLPVLTKDIVRERGRDLVRDDVPLESLSPHFSGGSTGVPLRFYRDRTYMEFSKAGIYRNLMQAGWRRGEMIAFFWGWDDRLEKMPGWEFELRQRLRRMYQFNPFRSGPADMDRWLRRWRSIRPRVALGYASTISRFAAHLEKSGSSVPPVRGVFTTAEKLYAPQRELIERVFQSPVFDCYGSSEVQNIAAECRQARMHINADFVVVEAASSVDGGPTPLLLTSLKNFVMPFIRYRNEDCGDLIDGSCDCGSGFPLMKLNVARVSDNFVLPGDRIVHGEFFTHLLYGSEGIASFQFHQKALDHIVVWIVPDPASSEQREAAIRKAVERIRGLTPAPVQIDVHEVEGIPLTSTGKHRFTRSEVAASALGAD